MHQRPVAIGLLLCEQLIVEEATRNLTPVNCFTRRIVGHFPVELSFVVLVYLTGGRGVMQLALTIQRLDTLEDIFRREQRARFEDPLADVRLLARLQRCSFPDPGAYQMMLLADGEMVALRKFYPDASEGMS